MKMKFVVLLTWAEKKAFKEQLLLTFPMIRDSSFTHDFINKQDDLYYAKVKVYDKVIVDVYILNDFLVAFAVKKKIFPSVFFLWKYPDCLLSFTTYYDVVSKLVDGAYIMLSGIAYPKFNPDSKGPKFKRHTPVYINATTNKAAVAVGITAANSNTFCQLRNQGKCVLLLHFWGDYLCTIASVKCSPIPQLGYPEWMKKSMKSISGLYLPTREKPKKPIMCDECVETQEMVFKECTEIEKVLMNKLVTRCFLTAVKYSKLLIPPVLLTSFCSTYLTPSCSKLDITKSSYGRFKHFIIVCWENNLIELDYRNGTYIISKICKDHPLVVQYTYDPNKKPFVKIINDRSPMLAEDCYSVTVATLPVFEPFGFVCGSAIVYPRSKKYIRDYIKFNGLEDKHGHGIVHLNEVLKSLSSNTTNNRFLQDISVVFKNIVNAMCPSYLICIRGLETVHKGKLLPIVIQKHATLSLKKMAIAINTQVYGIELKELILCCHYYGITSAKIIRVGWYKKVEVIQFSSNRSKWLKYILQKLFGIPRTRIIDTIRNKV